MATKIKRYLRISYFTLVMYLITHAIVFLLFLVWFLITIFNPKRVPKLKVLFANLIFMILHKRIAVSGLNKLDKSKRYLIVANYPSGYAGFVMMKLFPKASIIAHSLISKVPILSNMLRLNGFIYVYHKGYKKIKHSISQIIEGSKSNSIIILPEGKITPDGQIHEFKHGFIHIIRRSSLDLLPVTLCGFYTLKPFMRPYINPDAQLKVIIHEPIVQATMETMGDEELVSAVQNRIEDYYEP